MLRDKNLIPLSHQHQHALSLCVRIDRAADADLAAFQAEIEQMWDCEIQWHFRAEEQVLFPAAGRFPEMAELISELLHEHEVIRGLAATAAQNKLEIGDTRQFATALSAHVRKEERQLFEECQRLMSTDEMNRIGSEVERFLSGVPGQSCALRPKSQD